MLQKIIDMIEKNWVHFLIQQPQNIQNQLTDLKQLSFLYTSVIFVLLQVQFHPNCKITSG